MTEKNEQVLSIGDGLFLDVRNKFDFQLEQLISKMTETGNSEGTIGLKLKVEIREGVDELGDAYPYIAFDYEVNTEIKEKNRLSGYSGKADRELKFDEADNVYKLIELPKAQMDMGI